MGVPGTGNEALQTRKGSFNHSKAVGYLAMLIASACWGTSGIFVKFIVAHSNITALTLAFWRDMWSFIVLLTGIGLLRSAWLRVSWRDLPWLAAMGGSLGIFHIFWNLGVLVNGAAVTTVQQAAVPAVVTIAARLIWRESLTWHKLLAIGLTFAGTVLASGLDVLGQTKLTASGFLIGIGIPFTYSSWMLFGKKVRAHYQSLTIMTYAFGFGALVLLPFQFFTPQPWPVPLSALFWFAGLISLATVFAFTIYTFGLGRLQASVASILTMSEIFFVFVYAYFLLNERMTISQSLGALLVISGVCWLSWNRWQNKG